MGYRWSSSSRTDRGRRRPTNEDAVLELPECGVWLVADGMGGHTRGDLASRSVVEAFEDIGRARRLRELMAKARLRLHQANERIHETSRRLGPQTIMGCTAAVLLTNRHEFACLWVGDSRVYRLREGVLEQLTHDHSLLQELIDRGELSAAEAVGHPAGRRITRAVGAQPNVRVDEVRGHLRDGDLFLLCSDGLPLEVGADEIASALSRTGHEEAVQDLVELSLARGARDNVSVMVVRVEETPAFQEDDDTTAVNPSWRRSSTTGIDTHTTLTGL